MLQNANWAAAACILVAGIVSCKAREEGSEAKGLEIAKNGKFFVYSGEGDAGAAPKQVLQLICLSQESVNQFYNTPQPRGCEATAVKREWTDVASAILGQGVPQTYVDAVGKSMTTRGLMKPLGATDIELKIAVGFSVAFGARAEDAAKGETQTTIAGASAAGTPPSDQKILPAEPGFDLWITDPALDDEAYMCVLLNGEADCFSMLTGKEIIPKQSGIKKIALGQNLVCLISTSDDLHCFFYGDAGAASPDLQRIPPEVPSGEKFSNVLLNCNGYTACGHKTDGGVRCWGSGSEQFDENFRGLGDKFNEISCGMAACALIGNRFACNGYSLTQEARESAPSGFDHLSGGHLVACAVNSERGRAVRCLVEEGGTTRDNYPKKNYANVIDVNVDIQAFCILNDTGLECTGFPALQLVPFSKLKSNPTHLSQSYQLVCAVGKAKAECFGKNLGGHGGGLDKLSIPARYRGVVTYTNTDRP